MEIIQMNIETENNESLIATNSCSKQKVSF